MRSRGGFALDVWCDSAQETAVLRAELGALESLEQKGASGSLLYELGRIYLQSENEPAAAEALLRSYTVRPQFRPTMRLARLLYRERSEFRLVIKLLDAEARATRDPFSRAALMRQQSRIYWSRLGDPSGARTLLESAHRVDPSDLTTIKLLKLLYSIEGDRESLIALLGHELEAISDASTRTALLTQQALLCAPDDTDRAIECLRAADRNEPDHLSVLLYLELLYETSGQHRELAETLIREADHPQASQLWRAKLLARAARIQRDQTLDDDTAVALFQRSLDAQPLFAAASDFYDLLIARERFAEAVKVGARLFELDDTAAFRSKLACQLADLCRTRLKEPETAADWYRRCLEVAPSYQPALEGLGWVLEGSGDIEKLLAIHRSDLAAARDGQARAQRLFRIGVLLERAGRDEEALETHREALHANPTFKPSLSALQRLFSRFERWTELLQLFDEELGHEPDQERVIYILETMASLWYHQLGQPDNALDCCRRILELDPDNHAALSSAARLCSETRRWQELADLNERELKLTGDAKRRVDLLQRTGEVWEDHLLNLDRAVACYTQALSEDPSFLPALKALGRLYRQKGRWADLIRMHRAEIAASGDTEQILALLYDIAEIQEEEQLEELPSAETYRAILQRRPGHRPALAALSRILERHTDWAALAELRESSLDGLSDPRSKALQLWTAGIIREERLNDPGGATKDYLRALRLAPDLAPAQAALGHLLEESGEHQLLAEHLEAALEQEQKPGERASLAQRLADLCERALGNPRKAATLYERAAADSPGTWMLWAQAQIYEELDMPRELCAVLEKLLATLSDQRQVAELQLRIAHLQHEHSLRDPVPTYVQSMSHSATRIHARRALEELLHGSERLDDQVDLLMNRIDGTKDPMELCCLWTELAEVQLRRQDRAGAETAYREAVASAPGHLTALHGLGTLLEQQERWTERAELAERAADTIESSRGLAEALVKAGKLWEDRVGDASRALPIYKRVLKAQPGHPEAFDRLRAIYNQSRDWPALASVIRSQITATSDQAATVDMLVELGRLYLTELDQPKKGVACLRRVLDLEPDNVYSLTTLGDMAFTTQDYPASEQLYTAAEVLVKDPAERQRLNRRLGDIHLALGHPAAALDSYQRAATDTAANDPELLRCIAKSAEAAGAAAPLIATLEKLAEMSNDSAERIELRKRIARLASDSLDDDERPLRALEEVLALDPLDIEAIERLAGIYGRSGNRSAVVQHLQASTEQHRAELARHPFDPRLYRQVGRIFQWQRQLDRLYCACLAQSALGSLDDVDQRFMVEHQRRCGPMPKGAVAKSRYDSAIVPEAARGPARDLLVAAGPVLQRLAAVDMESLGLDKSSKVKQGQPLRTACDELAAVLGGVTFDLYVSRTKPDLVAAEYLNGPALVLGSRLASGNVLTAAERFRIGRALFLLLENALVLRDRSVREIRQLFLALGRAATPICELPLRGTSDDSTALDDETKQVLKLLGRKDRKLLGSFLPGVATLFEGLDLGEFARALSYGANRAGLLLAGDAKPALDEAMREMGGPAALGPDLGDLLQYLVSEEYFSLRLELGLAPVTAVSR
jgi:cellulose synthase operon protein C